MDMKEAFGSADEMLRAHRENGFSPREHGARRRQRIATPVEPARRPWLPALARGLAGHCPACGEGALFSGGLRVRPHCDRCGEALYHERAGKPAHVLAALVGAQVLLALMWLAHIAGMALPLPLWLPLGALFIVGLVRPMKGAIVGLQWALRLHGFQYAAMCRPRRRRDMESGRERGHGRA